MNKKQKGSIAMISMVVAFLAMTCITASSGTSNTPLYTFRMEQASSGMSFLSTTVNEFSYNTRDGYTLNWGFFVQIDPPGVFKCGSDQICPDGPEDPSFSTCCRTCPGRLTCSSYPCESFPDPLPGA
jgi:hypothetical protein